MKIRKRSQFPKCIRHFKQVKGICIGECIDKNYAIQKGHGGHAHCYGDQFNGWICLKYKYQLKERLTLLHEVAHLIANADPSVPPHGKAWRDVLVSIGGTFKSFSYTHGNLIHTNIDYTYRPRQR
jgi:hypothetical protein